MASTSNTTSSNIPLYSLSRIIPWSPSSLQALTGVTTGAIIRSLWDSLARLRRWIVVLTRWYLVVEVDTEPSRHSNHLPSLIQTSTCMAAIPTTVVDLLNTMILRIMKTTPLRRCLEQGPALAREVSKSNNTSSNSNSSIIQMRSTHKETGCNKMSNLLSKETFLSLNSAS